MKGLDHWMAWCPVAVGRRAAASLVMAFLVTLAHAQDYQSVSAGTEHTCAVQASGAVQCWGAGGNGRLGHGGLIDAELPNLVAGLPAAARAVAAGGAHSCAVLVNREVWCWGLNDMGQLGNGTFNDSAVPVRVTNINTAVAVTTGGQHTCALLSDGAARCWGAGGNGRLGRGSNTGSFVPVAVTGIDTNSRATQISAGVDHTCAVMEDDSVRCWGRGANGRLGNGDSNDRNVPTTVSALPGAAFQVAAGGAHTCARIDLSLYCWGAAGSAQLGNGSFSDASTPVAVTGLAGGTPTAVAVGAAHSCAVLSANAVRCWGENLDGQLGIGGGSTLLPQLVVGVQTPASGAGALAAGGAHSCVILRGGGMRCWGAGDKGQRGDGGSSARNLAVTASGALPMRFASDHVSAGVNHNCLRSDRGAPDGGVVQCWGNNDLNKAGPVTASTPTEIPGLTGVQAVAAGGTHSCALLADGGVRCWGSAINGALGNGSFSPVPSAAAVAVIGLGPSDPAAAITAGAAHTCARLVSGLVRCWGLNLQGQLGNGGNTASHTPVTVSSISAADPAIDISAGSSHTCAVLQSGIVRCWGSGANGRLGHASFASSNVPVTVSGITAANRATQVAGGESHTCARLSSGEVRCWGAGADGRLGDGASVDRSSPVTVTNLDPATAVTAGGRHSCALTSGSFVYCWGDGAQGQLGHGLNSASATPVQAVGVSALQLDAGSEHTCAASTRSVVQCWGSNSLGQLGDGLPRRSRELAPRVVGGCTLDLDGDGTTTATTDGLLLARALLGFSGSAVTSQAIATGAARQNWGAIKAHLERYCGVSGLAP